MSSEIESKNFNNLTEPQKLQIESQRRVWMKYLSRFPNKSAENYHFLDTVPAIDPALFVNLGSITAPPFPWSRIKGFGRLPGFIRRRIEHFGDKIFRFFFAAFFSRQVELNRSIADIAHEINRLRAHSLPESHGKAD